MVRKMLLGLKQRAEATTAAGPDSAARLREVA
jgi:hypothetical protein